MKKQKLIHSGSFSEVHLATPDPSPKAYFTRYLNDLHGALPPKFAAKIVAAADEHLFKREVRVLAALQQISPAHFIRLYDTMICVEPGKKTQTVSLVMCLELATCDLYELSEEYRLAPCVVQRMIREVAAGLHVMHTAGYIHTDIKPENIFFISNEDLQASLDAYASQSAGPRFVIADFDTCQTQGKPLNKRVGTTCFKAPELCMRLDYTSAIDIWSLGMLYFEALTGKGLIKVDSPSESLSASSSSSDDMLPWFIEEIAQMEFYFGKMPVGLLVSPAHYTGGGDCPNCSAPFTATKDSELKHGAFTGVPLTERLKKIDNSPQHAAFVSWLAQMNPLQRPSAEEVANSRII
jgi:serine/threonine protein kinase